MFNLCDIGPPRVSVRQPADRLVAASQARVQQPQWQQESPAHNGDTPQRPQGSSFPAAADSPASNLNPPSFPTPSRNTSAPCSPSLPSSDLPPAPDAKTHHHRGQDTGLNGAYQPTSGAAEAARQVFEQAQPGSSGGYVDGSAAAAPASTVVTARTKARLADLSLLLDVLLKSSSSAVKRDFVACGILSQIQQVVGRNFGREYAVILRKVCKVVESLPLTADDLHATRSAHGSFADVLRILTTNGDFDVRTKAALLLRKYPSSAVSDLSLIKSANGTNGRNMGNAQPHQHTHPYRDSHQQQQQQPPGTPPVGANGTLKPPPPYTNGYGPPRSLRPVRPYNASPAGDTPSRASPHANTQPWAGHAEPDANTSNWDAPDTSAPSRYDTYPPSNGATPSNSSLPPGLPRSRIGRPMRGLSLRETSELQTPGKPSPARHDAPPTPSGAGCDSPGLAWATATAAAAATASADDGMPAPKRRRRSFTDGPEAGSPSLTAHLAHAGSAANENPPPPSLPHGSHSTPQPAPSPQYAPSHTQPDAYTGNHNHHHHHSHSSGYQPSPYSNQQYVPSYSHHHHHHHQQQQHYGQASYHQPSNNSWDNMHHHQQQHYYQGQQQHYQEQHQQQPRAPPKAPNSSPPPLPVDDIPVRSRSQTPPPPPPVPIPPHALLSAEEVFALRVCVPLWGSGAKPRYPAQPTPFKRAVDSGHGSDSSSSSFYGEPTSATELFSLGIYGGQYTTTAQHVPEDAMELDADDEARSVAGGRWQPGPGMSPILRSEEFSPVHQPEADDPRFTASCKQQAADVDVEAVAGGPFGAGNLLVVDLRSMAVAGSRGEESVLGHHQTGRVEDEPDPQGVHHGVSPSDATALLRVTSHHLVSASLEAGLKGDAEEPAGAAGHQAIHSNGERLNPCSFADIEFC